MNTDLTQAFQNCLKFGLVKSLKSNNNIAQESKNENEQADLPDGSIRYNTERQNYSEARTKKVKQTSSGSVTYQNCNNMKKISFAKYNDFQLLIKWLKNQNVNIILFLTPFSSTQSEWIYTKKSNPVFIEIENKLLGLAEDNNIKIIGSYNAKNFNLTDDDFIDFMHPDKNVYKQLWNNNQSK